MARALPEQVGRFLVVGVFSAGSQYGIYLLLVGAFDLRPWLGALLGTVVGTLISYYGNARFTFEKEGSPGAFGRFVLVTALGAGLNAGLSEGLVLVGMHYALAGIVAVGCAAAFNFTGHKLWTFK